jgi:hypothetical protein
MLMQDKTPGFQQLGTHSPEVLLDLWQSEAETANERLT